MRLSESLQIQESACLICVSGAAELSAWKDWFRLKNRTDEI